MSATKQIQLISLKGLFFTCIHSTMLGCFNPNLGQIWTNPNFGLKKKCHFKF